MRHRLGPLVGLLALLSHAAGIYLFMSGFLLSKTALPTVSTCDDPALHAERISGAGQEGCWAPPRFRRAVLLVVDALRLDMAVYNSSDGQKAPFENRLPVLERLLRQHPGSSALYRFVADAPTTTMQRLKGMTTGGLPTLIDVGSSFHSEGAAAPRACARQRLAQSAPLQPLRRTTSCDSSGRRGCVLRWW